MKRRQFLKSTLAGGVALQSIRAGEPLPQRPYKDGVQLSVIGFGGIVVVGLDRSEERRVGKECRSRWSPYH